MSRLNILSKNVAVEVSIQKMQGILDDMDCALIWAEEKHPLNHCYSINLASGEAPSHIYSNGKGTHSLSSKASAMGEYIERLQTNNFFIDFHLPQRAYYPDEKVFDFGGDYLNDELHALYDAEGELGLEDLVDFNSDYNDKIVALPFVNSMQNQQVYIPLNILSNLYVSNGLASGNDAQEAKVQALSEIFERYAKLEIIKKGYALPQYPEAIIASFPKLHHDIVQLRKAGFIIEVLDASLGGLFPVTAISLINPFNATLFVSFGAHPILEVSLERTLSELMQGRGLENLDTFETPTFDMSLVEDSFNLESHFIDSNGKMGFAFLKNTKSFAYAPWVYKGEGSEAEYQYLQGIVHTMGKEIYLREYTYLDFYSCQMIVPGISEVYPIEDLVYHNRNAGKAIRTMVLDFKQSDSELLLEAIEGLDESLSVEKYIGVIFEQNFTMGDLKGQLHLLLGQFDEALSVFERSELSISRVLSELLHVKIQELAFVEFQEGLEAVFGAEKVDKARSIIEGLAYMIDVTLHVHYANILVLYDKLHVKKATMIV